MTTTLERLPAATTAAAADPPPGPSPVRRRLRGLDAFRGLVLAAMVLTPVTGSDGSYPHLGHAAWNGLTVADVMLPAFLVASGASLALLLRPPVGRDTLLRLLRRLVALVILGVLYNTVGAPLDLGSLRLTGVLQTIGVSGSIAALVVLGLRRLHPTPLLPLGVALAGTAWHGWGLSRASSYCARPFLEGPGCSPFLHLDLEILGAEHLYRGGTTYDPEGVVATLAASALVLFGAATMAMVLGLRGRTVLRLLAPLAVGGALLLTGLCVADVQPINKRLHSPAFVLVTGGGALLGLGLLLALLDTRLPARDAIRVTAGALRTAAAWPLTTLGRNALVVYVGEHLILTALAATTGPGTSPSVLHHLAFDIFASTGHRAHLLTTAVVLGALVAVTSVMRLLRWRVVL